MSNYEETREAFNRRVNTQINPRMDGSGPTELAWEAWKAALAWRDSQGSLAAEVERLRAALTEQSAAAENEKLHAAVQAKFCGNDILDAIVRSDSIETLIIENRTFIIIWKANAAEQIEAALEEVTNAQVELPPNGGPESKNGVVGG